MFLLHVGFQILTYDQVTTLSPLASRFNVDEEQSIPTWFSQMLLFVAAALLFMIGFVKRKSHEQFAWHWVVLGIIFLYFSLDEGATLHETLGEYLKAAFSGLSGPFYFAWVIPFGVLACLFAVTYIKFLRQLTGKERLWLMAAGFIYVSGALGMEMVGGEVLSANLPFVYYVVCFTLEELLEMIGCALLITFAIRYMSNHTMAIRLGFSR